jgi:outer membrane protein OmpA-like peptidoglycan-associated protein
MKNKINSHYIFHVFIIITIVLNPQKVWAQNHDKIKSSMMRTYNSRSYYDYDKSKSHELTQQNKRRSLTGYIEEDSDLKHSETTQKVITKKIPAPLKKPYSLLIKKVKTTFNGPQNSSMNSKIEVGHLRQSDIQEPDNQIGANPKIIDNKDEMIVSLDHKKTIDNKSLTSLNHVPVIGNDNNLSLLPVPDRKSIQGDQKVVIENESTLDNNLISAPIDIPALSDIQNNNESPASKIKQLNEHKINFANVPIPYKKPRKTIPKPVQIAKSTKDIALTSKPSMKKLSKYQIDYEVSSKQDGPNVKALPPGKVTVETLPLLEMPKEQNVQTYVSIHSNEMNEVKLSTQVPRAPPAKDQFYKDLISVKLDPHSHTLSHEAKSILQDLAKNALNNNPEWVLQIQSFASQNNLLGTDSQSISMARAIEAKKILIDLGINEQRVDIRALGSQTNRDPIDRVDLVFTASTIN